MMSSTGLPTRRPKILDFGRGLCSYVWVSEAAPFSPADQYALIMDGLCRVVAARASRFPYLAPVLLILWIRLRRSVARFACAVRRAEAGPTRPRSPASTPGKPRPDRIRQRLPDNFAWVVVRVPEAAPYASQLQHLLAQPRMARLVEASPSLGRILRPLCRILGTPHTLPPPPSRPVPVVAKTQPPGWTDPGAPPDFGASPA